MRYTILPVVSVLLLLIIKQASAETRVIGTNTVNINSNGANSKSHVCIETNGEKNCFDTEGDESVDWTSDDGNSSVKINNNTVQPTAKQSSKSESQTSVTVNQDGATSKTVVKNEIKGTSSAASSSPTPKQEGSKSSSKFTFNLSEFFKGILSLFGFSKK